MDNSTRRRSPYNDRYRDRSSSRERPRTRTYDGHSESYDSEYSDDFEPDTKSRDRSPPRRRRENTDRTRRKRTDRYSTDDSSTSQLHSSTHSKKSTQGAGRGPYRKPRPKPGWKSHTSSKNEHTRSRQDNITVRLLSGKQRKINEIQNELVETEDRLAAVLKENKLLKTVQHRQDKALKRFQDVESDLPRLISQNFEEQKVLKTRLKKAQDSERLLEEKLRENNDEMQKMERTLRKLKKVVYDKNLGERSDLARQLTNTENNLTVAERRVKELEKKLELTTGSSSRQLKIERQKHKETKEKLELLNDEYHALSLKLKEKERALGVSNIYSHRNKEPSSLKSTPRRHQDLETSSTQTDASGSLAIPEPTRVINPEENYQLQKPKRVATPVKVEHNGAGFNKETKAERAKRILDSPRSSPVPVQPVKTDPILTTNALHSGPLKVDSGSGQQVFLTSNFQSHSPSSNNSLVQDSIEFEKEGGMNREQPNLRSTAHVVEGNDPFEEIIKQKKLEDEKAKLIAEQKRKAALLAKMREIEQQDGAQSPPPLSVLSGPSKVTSPPPFSKDPSIVKTNTLKSNPKSKSDLVKSLLGTDTDPVVENLHMGLPSNTKKPVEKPEKELSFGAYAPSVGTTQASRKPTKVEKVTSSDSDNDEPLFDLNSGQKNKKSDLLTQLFGDTQSKPAENSTPSKMGESVTPRAKPVHSGYPWEKNVVTTTHVNGNVNHVPNKIKTGLAVKAAAPVLDDDIEELTL